MRSLHLIPAAVLLASLAAPAAPPTPIKLTDNVQAIGEAVADKGTISVKGPKATLVIGAADADSYRLTAEVKPADKATSVALQVMPADFLDVGKQAALSGSF